MKHSGGPRVGLALGSGSARGWAHIGVVRVLEEAGIAPDVVCGTSIGALVGAAYAAGELQRLERWACSLNWKGVMGFLDFSIDGGLIKGAKLIEFFRTHFKDRDIAALPRTYGAVATEIESGREVWLTQGSLLDSVRASISLPGLFTPAERDGRLLVDGGLVNPVPVSLARALGADIVIAVDLNADLVARRRRRLVPAPESARKRPARMLERIQAGIASTLTSGEQDDGPSLLDVLTASINIMQVRITRSRLAGEPADVLIAPRLAHLALLDFHRAREAIEEGHRAATTALPQLQSLIGDISA
ncbi:MAG TPA: patatin-like phospholipase RssA [Burkholderiales bacterium]|nr:patatin-like phospholipase RssA [Burkholderiales bacterium]